MIWFGRVDGKLLLPVKTDSRGVRLKSLKYKWVPLADADRSSGTTVSYRIS